MIAAGVGIAAAQPTTTPTPTPSTSTTTEVAPSTTTTGPASSPAQRVAPSTTIPVETPASSDARSSAAPPPTPTTEVAPATPPQPESAAPAPVDVPLPARPGPNEPIAPEDPELSSKTAEPDPDWAPTQNPKSTIIPGQMRSDREEVPAPFTKEDADKAEILEAQDLAKRSTSRAAVTCQRYWPSWFDVCGAIRDKYNSLGGPGSFLSYPSSGNIINPGNTGERVTFLNGPIYWSNATGAHPVVNSFLNRWGIHGYEAGWMGYPTTDEIVHTDGVGRHQEFSNGASTWRSLTRSVPPSAMARFGTNGTVSAPRPAGWDTSRQMSSPSGPPATTISSAGESIRHLQVEFKLSPGWRVGRPMPPQMTITAPG